MPRGCELCQLWHARQLAIYKSLDFISVLQLFCIFFADSQFTGAGCLCGDCWHWSALLRAASEFPGPSGGTDRVHRRFFLSYGARKMSRGIIFSVTDIGHACFAWQDRCEECAREPQPLMRNGYCVRSLRPLAMVYHPGAMVFSRKSVMR